MGILFTRAQEIKSTNQNSGVWIDAIDNDGNKKTYYGCIEEIWELEYGPYMRIPLFRCQWVKLNGGVMVDPDYGMTTVDLNNIRYRDEPFILAKDVAQVFYVKDMSTIPKKRISKHNDQFYGEPRWHKFFQAKERSWELTRSMTKKITISWMIYLPSQYQLIQVYCWLVKKHLTCVMIIMKGHLSSGSI